MNFIFKLTDITKVKRISFRQDINGLRAIAVLAVVFYHAELELFRGGWLGVDIFFVISGYLISNIIISELNEGSFSFKTFYLRRAKRILPALFFTLISTLPFAYFFLTPKAMEEYIDSLIATILFYANYYFMNLDFYVAESTKLMPLLHTWSLAIEEQYYFLFPIFAFIAYKYFKKYLTFFVGLITVGSLYLNTLSLETDKFYKLEYRIWELLLGVMVMILRNNLKIKHLEKIGFPLMLFSIFYFDDNWINDAEPKLLALCGISLIILSNSNKTKLTKILSIKVLSIIGLASYSIYLLHQPVFVFYRIFFETNQLVSFFPKVNLINNLTLVLVTVLFGIFQYKFIELKFQNIKTFVHLIVLSTFIFITFVLIGFFTNGFDNRFQQTELKLNAINYQNLKPYDLVVENETCHKLSKEDVVKQLCQIEGNNSLKDIFILGDSHARLLIKPFSQEFNHHSISFATGTACIFFTNQINPDCKRSDQEEIINTIINLENTIIIYFADLQDKLDDKSKNVLKNVPITINKLSEKNIVIVIKQIPLFPINVGNKIITSRNDNEIKYVNSEWLNNKNRIEVEKMYSTFEKRNVYFVDSFKIFCNDIQENYCVGSDLKNIYIYDDNHPSITGSYLIIKEIQNIFDKINIQN